MKYSTKNDEEIKRFWKVRNDVLYGWCGRCRESHSAEYRKNDPCATPAAQNPIQGKSKQKLPTLQLLAVYDNSIGMVADLHVIHLINVNLYIFIKSFNLVLCGIALPDPGLIDQSKPFSFSLASI